MRAVLFIVSLLLTTPSTAQGPLAALVCKGKFSSYADPKILDMEDEAVVQVGNDTLTITGGVYFGGGVEGVTYLITHKTDSQIWFQFKTDPDLNGQLNRFTGSIVITKMTSKSQMSMRYEGLCERKAQKF
jgi:hypothetical protein